MIKSGVRADVVADASDENRTSVIPFQPDASPGSKGVTVIESDAMRSVRERNNPLPFFMPSVLQRVL
ncbi:MAG: hypothetical protein NTY86_21865 [Deltaproteobacteria bacterium]|jgi:hypothetical protein|nr:hypothetical protein [Deltaproteobacteria bacterium]